MGGGGRGKTLTAALIAFVAMVGFPLWGLYTGLAKGPITLNFNVMNITSFTVGGAHVVHHDNNNNNNNNNNKKEVLGVNIHTLRALVGLTHTVGIIEAYLDQELTFSRPLDRHILPKIWLSMPRQPSILQRLLSFIYDYAPSMRARGTVVHYNETKAIQQSYMGPSNLYSQGLFPEETFNSTLLALSSFDVAAMGGDYEKALMNMTLQECRAEVGTRLLNVGMGWAAFHNYAVAAGMNVTSVTNMAAQAKRARGGVVVVSDFYDLDPTGREFDCIVNHGATEHLTDYPALFAKYFQMLKPGGRNFNTFSARTHSWNRIGTFEREYIYPQGEYVYLPDYLDAAANIPGLEMVYTINQRNEFGATFEDWGRRLEANKDAVIAEHGFRQYWIHWMYCWGASMSFRANRLTSWFVLFEKKA